MSEKYILDVSAADEAELFYDVRNLRRDMETGCIGHMRFDHGCDGKGFWTTWENHYTDLNTTAFKSEFDNFVNALREGVLKSRSAMQSHCRKNPQAMLDDGRDSNYGFRIKTECYVYCLRCALVNDYSYIFAYERSRLEKCFPALAETPPKPSLTERIAKNKDKAAAQVKSAANKSKGLENSL